MIKTSILLLAMVLAGCGQAAEPQSAAVVSETLSRAPSQGNLEITFVAFHRSIGSLSVDGRQVYSGTIDVPAERATVDVALTIKAVAHGPTRFDVTVDGVSHSEVIDIKPNVDRLLIFPGDPFELRPLQVGESNGLD